MKQSVALLLCLGAVGYVNGAPTTSQLENGYANPPADKRQLFGGGAPTVTIANPSATIVGSVDSFLGIIPGKIESFKGIPFAQPPVGQLRLKPPMPLTAPLSTIQATNPLPPACPQFLLPDANITGLPGAALNLILSSPIFRNGAVQGQEDCLTVNVQRPAGTTRNSKLPVLLWIFGGGFELGSTLMYDASGLVGNSMALGKPIVFVAVNYRVGGFGFLPGKEILQDGSANLGLLDQRMAMQWVADNIAEFGGDPDQVTLWGESAGAISVYSQMLMFDGNITYKGKPLFRAGIMDSGSFVPTDPVDTAKGQQVYNTVVQNAGCAGKPDTLGCLRSVDFQTLAAATNSVPGILSFNSVALSYLPRPDGKVITQSPDLLIVQDKVAKVPFIIGDQEDEGTLFALFQSNLSTTADVEQYLASIFFKNASPQQISALVATYPDDPAAGSPFGTGADNNWYPQFKRLAALLGDATFTLVRRATLLGTSVVSKTSQTWSYLATYGHGTPIMGTFHATDILQVFYGLPDNTPRKMIQQYYFNFVYNMDPNNGTGGVASNEAVAVPNWTPWAQGQMIMNFSGNGATLMPDNFRQKSFEFLVQNVAALRF